MKVIIRSSSLMFFLVNLLLGLQINRRRERPIANSDTIEPVR